MYSVAEALKEARYGEAVLLSVESESEASENAREIILVATLDEDNGGIVWKDLSTLPPIPNEEEKNVEEDAGIIRHLRTKRWLLPMLNDSRRNDLYDRAIAAACIDTIKLHKEDPAPQNVYVLDIGTGTGLLGMLAAKHLLSALKNSQGDEDTFQDSVKVTSLEMASAMARLAKKTVESNQMQGYVDVVESHSCEATLQNKAHICVSELLESGLLGEGLLPAIRDAWKRHLDIDAVLVPQRARIFCQIVEGNDCIRCYRGPNPSSEYSMKMTTASNDDGAVLLGSRRANCFGDGIIVPLHAKALLHGSHIDGDNGPHDFRAVSDPVMVLDFDFSKDSIPGPEGRSRTTTVTPTSSGTAHGVLFWWELDLWADLAYSTEPDKEPWQDHWHQCLFVFPGDTDECSTLRQGVPVELTACHTDYKLSFSLRTMTDSEEEAPSKRPRQDEGAGTLSKLITSQRAMQLNCVGRITEIQNAISAALGIKGIDSPVLDLSDFSLCAILAALQGAQHVFSLESSSGGVPLVSAQVAQLGNSLPTPGSTFQVLQTHAENLTLDLFSGNPIQVVMAEPYYEVLEGWHLQEALNYFFLVRSLRRRGVISSAAVSVPSYARVMGCAIQFESFAGAYKRCGDTKGSSLVRGICHGVVNEYGARYHLQDASLPLWQYDLKKLTGSVELARISYEEPCVIDHNGEWRSVPFEISGTCHGLMSWVEYGLRTSGETEEFSSFSTNTRSHHQIVRMLPNPVVVQDRHVGRTKFSCKAILGGLGGQEDHSFELRVV